jgi:hypothetical protein
VVMGRRVRRERALMRATNASVGIAARLALGTTREPVRTILIALREPSKSPFYAPSSCCCKITKIYGGFGGVLAESGHSLVPATRPSPMLENYALRLQKMCRRRAA